MDDFNLFAGVDLEAWEDAFGEGLACDGTQPSARRQLFLPPNFSDTTREETAESWRTSFGFTACDFTALAQIHYSSDLGSSVSVMRHTVDNDTVEQAVRSDPDWSDELVERGDGDSAYYWWGENGFGQFTPARRLGRGGALANNDGLAVRVDLDERMEATLSASAGENSLSDLSSTQNLLSVLREAEVHTVVLTPPATDAEQTYAHAGFGAGNDADGRFGLLVFTHDDDTAAQANKERLEALIADGESAVQSGTRWSELLPNAVVAHDGVNVTLRYRDQDADASLVNIFFNAYSRSDSLFFPTP